MGSGKGGFTAGTAELIVVALFEVIFLALYFQSALIGDTGRTYFPFGAFIITLIPLLFEWRYRITFPLGLKMIIPFALFLHTAGGILRWYWIIPFFDKITHVVSTIAVSLIAFTVILFLDYRQRTKKKSEHGKGLHLFSDWKNDVLFGIVLITLICSLIWEILGEYALDLMFHTTYNWGPVDTVTDMMGNLIGLLIVLCIAQKTMDSIPTGRHLGDLLRPDYDNML
jgi:hypothetical protein